MSKRRKPKALKSAALRDRILTLFQKKSKERFNAAQIKKKLHITNSKDAINHALKVLSEEGQLKEVKPGRYKLDSYSRMKTCQGIIDMTLSGSAFVICDDMEQDVFVSRKKLNKALDGDEVEVLIQGFSRSRAEGQVIKILNRARSFFIGTYEDNGDFGFVVVNSVKVPFDFYVHKKNSLGAADGDKVIIKIENWGDEKQKSPIARVTGLLNDMDPHEYNMQSILISQGFQEGFPNAVMAEAKKLNGNITEEEISKRRDMREIPTFTIDPDTAKDFDDALSVCYLDNGNIQIGVHIADVSHYVTPGSALDNEAYARSTSVYLVDRVAPMLPEKLSNELCSLRPDEESLTFSAVFEFDSNFGIVSEWFGRSIIYSDKRFTYEEAQEVIDDKDSKSPQKEELDTLFRVYEALRKRRFKQGAVDFDSDELKIVLDENNNPVKIVPKVRLHAHMLIEEFMLLANRKVAEFVYKKEQPELPMVYRVHDLPDEERMTDFALFLKVLGFQFYMDSPGAIRSSINRLTEESQTNDLLKLVQPMAIRMMSKAIYTTKNIGHFGLSFEYYTHFTSPIRRYSDILVHRILYDNLEGSKRYDKARLEEQCQHISLQEKKAMEAERESIKYKQVEFISQFIGHEFEAIISGIIERGLFIKIIENHCEGLVDFSTLSESFDVSSDRLTAKGNISGHLYKLGDQVKIRVLKTDLDLRQIDMELVLDSPLF